MKLRATDMAVISEFTKSGVTRAAAVMFLPEDYQFDSLLLLYVCTGLDRGVYIVGLLLSKHSDPLFM